MTSQRPATLGRGRVLDLGSGRVQLFENGPADGRVIVFVQGLLVNADVWRDVVPGLAAGGARCITVDWPLGAHAIAMPEADLTPTGVADLIAELLERLDLDDVTIVANDTGGALTQIMLTRRPERVGRVVLTPSDSFEYFFPLMFRPLTWFARIPGAVWLIGQSLRLRFAQRLPMAYGWLSTKRLPDELVDSFMAPMLTSRAVRRDLARFLSSVHRRYTLAAAEALPAFERPVLLAWGTEDRFFPMSLAERLAAILPDARIVPVADAATLVPVDQPEILVGLVAEFIGLDART
ncbi:MAG: putative oxidoreductase [Marmoricola sp.]|nr:putative oxidoreductase [Marmoricola sp.]